MLLWTNFKIFSYLISCVGFRYSSSLKWRNLLIVIFLIHCIILLKILTSRLFVLLPNVSCRHRWLECKGKAIKVWHSSVRALCITSNNVKIEKFVKTGYKILLLCCLVSFMIYVAGKRATQCIASNELERMWKEWVTLQFRIIPVSCHLPQGVKKICNFVTSGQIFEQGHLENTLEVFTAHSRDIHAPGWIRTHNPSKRAAADLRLRPHGHWDRRQEE